MKVGVIISYYTSLKGVFPACMAMEFMTFEPYK